MAIPFRIPNQQQYMPQAAPVAPVEQTAAGPDDLYSRLAAYVDEWLDKDEPTAPTPESVKLSPWQAAAAALNPQSANQIVGLASQPVEARNQQAQMEFERAMQGRRDALGLASDMLKSQRSSSYGRAALANIEIDGMRHVVNVVRDGYGNMVSIEPVGANPFSPAMLPGVEIGPDGKPRAGIFRTPRQAGAPAERITGPSGSTIEPPVPPGLATEAGGKLGVLSRFPGIMEQFDIADASLGGSEEKIGQTINWVKSRLAGKSFGPIVAPEELINYYASVKSALFPIVKAGSGAVFPEQELQRWESRFPIPGVHSREEAAHLWDALISEIISDIKSKYGTTGRRNPIIDAAAPSKKQNLSGMGLPRSEYNRLSAAEKAEVDTSGVTIIEGE